MVILIVLLALVVNYYVGQHFIKKALKQTSSHPDRKVSKHSLLMTNMMSFNNRLKLLIEPIHQFLGAIVDMTSSLIDFAIRLFDIVLLICFWPYLIYSFRKGLDTYLKNNKEN